MKITKAVEAILSHYNYENPEVQANLARILMHGKLGGTGRMLILPVDQGFEHGPVRSFAVNPDAYDPSYHYKLAIDAGMSAYAAPLGFLEAGSVEFAGKIPTILKMNSSNSLMPKDSDPDQAITATVKDAVRLGCVAVGLTIYPGSPKFLRMLEEVREITREAKENGLAVIIWSYPRGGDLSKDGETAIDICAYAAHMAALMGANIIKVKPPTDFIEQSEAKKIYESEKIDISNLEARVRHINDACFAGKRLVLFSGGVTKSDAELLDEVTAIRKGGASGCIIGRNSFKRPRVEALALLEKICDVLAD